MATYGYIRVSTKPQSDGDSLENQERQVRGRALQEGRELTRLWIERGVSGSRALAARPEGAAMLAALAPGDLILCPKLDRLFRSASDALETLERFKAMGVDLILLDMGGNVVGGGIAAMTFGILAAVAQFERERIAERVREMKEHEKLSGKYRGGRREFGTRVTDAKRLEPVPEEIVAINLILKLAGEGYSLRKIQEQVFVACQIRMSHCTVARVLRDARVRHQGAA